MCKMLKVKPSLYLGALGNLAVCGFDSNYLPWNPRLRTDAGVSRRAATRVCMHEYTDFSGSGLSGLFGIPHFAVCATRNITDCLYQLQRWCGWGNWSCLGMADVGRKGKSFYRFRRLGSAAIRQLSHPSAQSRLLHSLEFSYAGQWGR